MSLTGALSSAISALSAQSQSLSMISDNIANSDTTGYKTTSAMFDALVTASSNATSYASGGVTVSGRANITQQGLLAATSNATDVAIQGSGFFAVSNSTSGGTISYTRNGAFTINNAGYLENNGNYLEGWRTDADGNVVGNESASNLTAINTQVASTSGSATTKTTVAANLPSDAATGDTYTSSMTVYDSLGAANSMQVTWTKTGTNTWSASFANPTSTSDTTTATGTASGTIAITFNSDGSLASTSPSPATVVVTGWTDGAADSSITLNLGTVGKTDGLTQYASGETTPSVNVTSIDSDGLSYGKLSSVSIGKDGVVDATYSNGQTIAIYKIAVATFADPNGLSARSDGIYSATVTSGNAALQASGENGAGTIYGSELESSTTDTSSQFSSMISAQQAYSAASQVISTVNKMYDTLISAMR
ncbi:MULTISPECIES: flagellar hook protein FlgE [Bradyrhizobium]|jgi:flagellar hook protein FlgE|uniref:Flagellar hook protein FlgE n=1 Tax=Bradyrhizobium diazoefficiens (strain JCM 10833 / BCRC 13528 / IAM 13628 / NBRC 14792 / USDA 110) TaxID=224911 RepID=Q89NY3_BRADU|nr:flagellar hook protein FlgE [Bradyrhizobium diazoefficiens]MBP1066352.1 flagellar hook protein FlgE [Bradyrhizobium japonicum]AND89041.1 flagellar hook protein FlgE [Bradyrhizobium diazoefficiens USDA 110]AWO90646.1 flagellar hook protein FlgE [Bradyrhizobium diazoefficiens]PDT60252.1 flagellar hook protein FlgE [Bradyrhizobium diazoefficiens]QBP22473.1 flagellar hook protein FlgE [Bradyrhizobium diazoefficiens]